MQLHKKKSLGQNFLRSSVHLKAIADAADLQPGELVVEVGPGEGTLTAELLARGARVIAVEKDYRLVPLLRERFAGQAFEVVEGDALEFELPTECKPGEWKLVGNIPYYITGALLRTFLSDANQPSLIVFLVQKEVAERIVYSNPDAKRSGPRPKRRGKESILSLSVKAYGEPKLIKTVPAGAFSPPPKVDSAILSIKNISRNNFESVEQEQRFFELVHAGFGSKRKLLASNLKPLLGEHAAKLLEKAGIDVKARAEDVSLEKWLLISKY